MKSLEDGTPASPIASTNQNEFSSIMEQYMKRIALLVPFVACALAQAEDLPSGKGKDLLEKICAECHGLDVIVSQRADKDGWAAIVDSMVARGAGGSKEDLDTIVDYLAKNFAPQKKIEKALNAVVAAKRGVR